MKLQNHILECGKAPSPLRSAGALHTRRRAFSLIEVMVAIALLTLIIVGLFSVFNQTQRAFRSSMNQTDQLEGGRAVCDSMSRELEQVAPSYGSAPRTNVNYFAQILTTDTPLVQLLPGSGQVRTNLIEDCFMLTRDNNRNWVGIGYCVRTNDAQGRLWLPEIKPGQAGAGSLYRYTYTIPYLYTNGGSSLIGLPQEPSYLFNAFQSARQPGQTQISNRVCDGVVHFRFRAFDTNGMLIVSGSQANTYIQTNNSPAPGEVCTYTFYSNAVPAFLELELGLLEARAFARFNAIGDPAARLAYIQRDDVTARVQLFRQRIAVRNVDPLAFQ